MCYCRYTKTIEILLHNKLYTKKISARCDNLTFSHTRCKKHSVVNSDVCPCLKCSNEHNKLKLWTIRKQINFLMLPNDVEKLIFSYNDCYVNRNLASACQYLKTKVPIEDYIPIDNLWYLFMKKLSSLGFSISKAVTKKRKLSTYDINEYNYLCSLNEKYKFSETDSAVDEYFKVVTAHVNKKTQQYYFV